MKRALTAFLAAILIVLSVPAYAFWPFDGPAKKKEVRVVTVSTPERSALTLEEAYRLTLKRSESLAIEEADMGLAQARFYQAAKYFLPNVYWQTARTERDVERDSSGVTGIGGDARRRVTPQDQFVFSQPLFSGFREFAALRGSGADKAQQRLEYERARQLLYVDVVDAYCAALQSLHDVEILRSTHRLLAERMKDLGERVRLGRSRESEAKTSLADLKLIEADLVSARSAAKAARNLLEFYIGEVIGERSLAELPVAAEPGELAQHLPKAARRADVLAAKEAETLAAQAITSARAGFLPSASLDGNYYTRRVGFNEGNDWDVTIKAVIPIFDAGQTIGDMKEAGTLHRVAVLRAQETRRRAELEIRNAFEDYRSALAQRSALASAAQANRANYDIQAKEYSFSLVNNLEVLDSLRRYEEVERRRNTAEYEAQRAHVRFLAATGEVS
jgi:outer membrane protein